jgi:hypothetical protein
MVNAPYAGPFYGPDDPRGRGPDQSPYLNGVKRGLSRAGYIPWNHFDGRYNRNLQRGALEFQKDALKAGTATGWGWGRPSHEALERARRVDPATGKKTNEPALDPVAIMLMEDGYDLKHPPIIETPLERVRDSIAEYLEQCERYDPRIHYLQQRPMKSLGDEPSHGFYGDCSEECVAACYWARTHTGIHVPDPGGYGYAGYGNSDSLYRVNFSRKVSGYYMVGDIAVYGPSWKTQHVTMCRKEGGPAAAIFTSHGSESGPVPTRVGYRGYYPSSGGLLAVVRPRLIP